MTDQHQHRAEPAAEPEQWYQCASALIERLSRLEEGYDELAARMEQVESTQHARVTGLSNADIKAAELEWARTAPGMRSNDLRAASAADAQQLTLVERTAQLLAAAFSRSRPGDCLLPLARAMLREVAAGVINWDDSDQLIRTGWEAGKWLEREANR
jgi:hypothetical protein